MQWVNGSFNEKIVANHTHTHTHKALRNLKYWLHSKELNDLYRTSRIMRLVVNCSLGRQNSGRETLLGIWSSERLRTWDNIHINVRKAGCNDRN
jgi:hypothetical protein